MSLRPALPHDIPVLVGLMDAFYREAGFTFSYERAAAAFRTLASDPALGSVWLIENGGREVGYVAVTRVYSLEYSGVIGWIDDFFIEPAARHRGLGGAALERVRAACASQGLRALSVEVGPDNAVAQAVYRRIGMSVNGRAVMDVALAAPLHEDEGGRGAGDDGGRGPSRS